MSSTGPDIITNFSTAVSTSFLGSPWAEVAAEGRTEFSKADERSLSRKSDLLITWLTICFSGQCSYKRGKNEERKNEKK